MRLKFKPGFKLLSLPARFEVYWSPKPMSCWLMTYTASLSWSSSCGIRGAHSFINFDSPAKTIPAPCGISQPCSVAELKGHQISISTVFILSGTETPCQLREFTWCRSDFFPHPLLIYIYTKGKEGALQTQETVTSSSFSCSAAA